MEKLNSHNKGNVWENTNIPKLCFLHILCEVLIHASPKIWGKKVNSHSKGKIWENINISKLRVS